MVNLQNDGYMKVERWATRKNYGPKPTMSEATKPRQETQKKW